MRTRFSRFRLPTLITLIVAVPVAPLVGQTLITRGDGIIGRILLGPAGSSICMMTGAGAPTDGTSGTGTGGNSSCAAGSVYVDVTNKTVYNNTNTGASPTWQLVGGNPLLRYATLTLTNAQVLALNTTPVTVLAAPGTNLGIDVLDATLSFNYTATYTNGTNLKLWYTSRASNAASSAIVVSGLLTGVSADASEKVLGTPDGSSPIVNAPVALEQIYNTAFGGGNASNALVVEMAYRVISMP